MPLPEKLPANAVDSLLVQVKIAQSLADVPCHILDDLCSVTNVYCRTHFEDLASSNDASSSDNCCILGVDALDKQHIAMKEYVHL